MRSILYWSFLILVSLVLAYVGPFNVVPLVFLGGAIVLTVGYFSFLSYRRRRSGVWEQGQYQVKFIGSILLYVMFFWTTVGLFSNVKEQREFMARYEPFVEDGSQRGYTFYYLDYAGFYERINSPALNEFIAERKPERVRMVLEIVKDFGSLRAYTVLRVESIAVDKTWIDGNPPWAALRQ